MPTSSSFLYFLTLRLLRIGRKPSFAPVLTHLVGNTAQMDTSRRGPDGHRQAK
jgi:hypothetical protein